MAEYIECENCNSQAAIWFEKGRMSIRRKNESGCCCIIDDSDNIISVCGAHQQWFEEKSGVDYYEYK